jgi:nicotinate-nucleotide pyrophosphorylase (carboxylating)
VLLDNLSQEEARRCVEIVRGLRGDCVVETLGGITLQNVRLYAETGADYISPGALTQAAAEADVSLLVDSLKEK